MYLYCIYIYYYLLGYCLAGDIILLSSRIILARLYIFSPRIALSWRNNLNFVFKVKVVGRRLYLKA